MACFGKTNSNFFEFIVALRKEIEYAKSQRTLLDTGSSPLENERLHKNQRPTLAIDGNFLEEIDGDGDVEYGVFKDR